MQFGSATHLVSEARHMLLEHEAAAHACRNTKYELPADDEIDPSEITICKRPDGTDWCLGGGQHGKVHAQVLSSFCCFLNPRRLSVGL